MALEERKEIKTNIKLFDQLTKYGMDEYEVLRSLTSLEPEKPEEYTGVLVGLLSSDS